MTKKHRYHFGIDYFGNWTVTELIYAGIGLIIKGENNG